MVSLQVSCLRSWAFGMKHGMVGLWGLFSSSRGADCPKGSLHQGTLVETVCLGVVLLVGTTQRVGWQGGPCALVSTALDGVGSGLLPALSAKLDCCLGFCVIFIPANLPLLPVYTMQRSNKMYLRPEQMRSPLERSWRRRVGLRIPSRGTLLSALPALPLEHPSPSRPLGEPLGAFLMQNQPGVLPLAMRGLHTCWVVLESSWQWILAPWALPCKAPHGKAADFITDVPGPRMPRQGNAAI